MMLISISKNALSGIQGVQAISLWGWPLIHTDIKLTLMSTKMDYLECVGSKQFLHWVEL